MTVDDEALVWRHRVQTDRIVGGCSAHARQVDSEEAAESLPSASASAVAIDSLLVISVYAGTFPDGPNRSPTGYQERGHAM